MTFTISRLRSNQTSNSRSAKKTNAPDRSSLEFSRSGASNGCFWKTITIVGIALVASIAFPASQLGAQDTGLLDPPTASPDEAAKPDSATNPGEAAKPDNETGKAADRPKPKERARKTYLGRIVAKPMSHLGAPWLTRPERENEERASVSYQQLKLKEGMTVCDLGCGNGFWTLPMAKSVGESGSVLAVDIQQEMLQKLRVRAAKAKIANIKPILGKVDDPRLPANTVDLLLMVDVYHEFSHPESMLWSIRNSLTATGVVALLEYRKEDPKVPIKQLHKMPKSQIMKEYEANGFKLVREYNKLPWQHLMFFARDDSPLEKIDPVPTEAVLQALQSE